MVPISCARGYSVLRLWNTEVLQNAEGCWAVLEGSPSPDWGFTPEGRGDAAAPLVKGQ